MSAFIGPLGGLVQIECPSDLRPTMERPFAEKSTTSGIVRQQVSQRTRRQWDFAVGVATPSEAAQLAAIVAGEFGYGPFWFVDPWAQVTNLLHPDSSTLDFAMTSNMTLGGPVNLADGTRAGRSLVIPDPASIVTPHRLGTGPHNIPVIPGEPVIGTAYASGAGTVSVRLTWWDASGAEMGSTSFTDHTPGSVPARVWRGAGSPPDGAASVSVGIRGANRITRPAITWGAALMDWHVGQGAPSVAIPASLSQDIILATREARTHGRMASVSTTIREVG